jgi:hypothetical protein
LSASRPRSSNWTARSPRHWNAIGPERIGPPVWNCQSGLPVFASIAKKLPSFEPLKTNPRAVHHVGAWRRLDSLDYLKTE